MTGRCWSRAILPTPTRPMRMVPFEADISEDLHGQIAGGRDRQGVAQRQGERGGFDLEHVPGPRRDAVAERQGRGAEEVDVQVAGAEERRVFEVVPLQVL